MQSTINCELQKRVKLFVSEVLDDFVDKFRLYVVNDLDQGKPVLI